MGAGVPDGLQTRLSLERGTVGSIPTRLRQFPGPGFHPFLS